MTDSPFERGLADAAFTDDHGGGYRPFFRPMESTHLVRADTAALADLQLHWGSAYVIGLDGDIWSATFRGSADELRAHTALELRTLFRADYSYRQQAGQRRRRVRRPAPCEPPAVPAPPAPDDDRRDGTGGAPRPQQGPSDEPHIHGERMSL